MNTGLKPALRLAHRLDHLVGDVGVGVRPGVDDFVVALAVRDVAGLVRALEPLDALLGFLEQLGLGGRNLEIFDADRDAAARGVGESELLQAIEELHRRRRDPPCGRTRTPARDSAFFFMSMFLKPSSFGTIALNNTRPAVVFSQRLPFSASLT